jgi:hypothetical protein
MKRLAIVAAAVLFTNAALAQPQYDLLLTGGRSGREALLA